ncbi:hypothetical protein C3432_23975 [Citrobacter amalonaticus]|uniref:L-asparaginase n=1 Tax=Citrobacter amalonaticus TaxID=35703 RepID=A0A2S4RSN9_CITAM|nr:hypothetical protein C3432_23975 [Citrobacter amalonaticus]POT71263.1 hypothetical protein C3436_23040 [Citrobacter amalonaticus]POU62667.1 hypothetical protein C3430_21275 [Citrobacter amalonaticus]POV02985.1 hypothetical protein C3424_22865 [Citrobacter amalonaticus]
MILRSWPIGYFTCHLNLGNARHPHVLRVRSGCCGLSVFKLPAPITPGGSVSNLSNYKNSEFMQ